MFSLDLMTVPMPLQMATQSPQLPVSRDPLDSRRVGLAQAQSCPTSEPTGFDLINFHAIGSVPAQKRPNLFTARKEETLLDPRCLLATAVITLFNVSDRKLPEVM